jgi:hypothetical protein
MSYDVIRHAAISGPFKFMKVVPDAVYFNTSDGSNQLVIHMDEKYHNAKGSDVLTKLRNEVLGRGRKATPDELIKAAKAYAEQFSSVKHSDDDPDILTDDDVEIIEAPYPENGKAQIPRRSFIYDDEDGYPQDYFEHHGILGMKWGVRRYQNKDGSLTDAGRKHYGRNYTIHELKKNLQDPNLSYSEKKGLVAANKVNRVTKTPYRKAATSVATATTGLAGAGTLAGLMAAGVLSVNPLLPVAALAGGVVTGKAINAGRDILNTLRTLRVEMIDRELDKQKTEGKDKKSDKGIYVVAKPGELPESTRVTGKEEEEFWKAYAKQVAPKASSDKPASSDRPAASPRYMSNIPNDPKAPGTFEQRRSAYISEHKSELLKNAKDKGTFDMEFLESNGDTDKYGAPLEGKELMAAYEKYLDEEIKRGK